MHLSKPLSNVTAFINLHLRCASHQCYNCCAGVASKFRGPDKMPTTFKFVQVLAALERPDAALAVLRARAHITPADQESSEEAFQEAQTALSIRLRCGVFTEACSEVGSHPCCWYFISLAIRALAHISHFATPCNMVRYHF